MAEQRPIVMRLPRLFGQRSALAQQEQSSEATEGIPSIGEHKSQGSAFEGRWESLHKGLIQVVDCLEFHGISNEQWMDMYTAVYTICAFDKGNVVQLYVNLCKFVKAYAARVAQKIAAVVAEGSEALETDVKESSAQKDSVIHTENEKETIENSKSVVAVGRDQFGAEMRARILRETLKQWESYHLVGELTAQIFKYMEQKWIPFQQRSIQSIGGALVSATPGQRKGEGGASSELVGLLGVDRGVLDILSLFMFFWREEIVTSSNGVGERIRDEILAGVDQLRRRHALTVKSLGDYTDSANTISANVESVQSQGLPMVPGPPPVEEESDPRQKELVGTLAKDGGDVSIGVHGLHALVFSYVELGSGRSQPLQVYKEEFEKPFLRHTSAFLAEVSSTVIEERSTGEYLRFAEEMIKREMELGSHLLHPSTVPHLVRVCRKALMDEYFFSLVKEFPSMLEHQRNDDIKRLYDLSKHSLKFVKRLSLDVRAYITAQAKDAIEAVMSGAKDDKEGLTKKRAMQYVKELLNRHADVWNWLKSSFEQHSLVKQKAEEAFEDSLNRSIGPFRVVELLSFYCDAVLAKKEKMTEKAAEECLDGLLQLLSHVSDKDLFHEGYRTFLSRRLLQGGNRLDMDMERTMLGLIKVHCGAQFVKKPEGMFHDMELSIELSRRFQAYLGEAEDSTDLPELATSILHQTNWPLSAKETIREREPFTSLARQFEGFYAQEQKSKKLTWLFKEGSVVLQATVKGTVEVVMTPYQAMIMLLFNDREQWRFEEILNELGGSEEELQVAIGPLLYSRTRLLRRASKSVSKRLLLSDRVAVNPQVGGLIGKRTWPKRSMMKRGMESALIQEDKDTAIAVEEDRRFQVDAAIVRVMKSRRQLSHVMLVTEVSTQLMSHFKPDPKLIKERIASLMELDFIERDSKDPQLYKYLA